MRTHYLARPQSAGKQVQTPWAATRRTWRLRSLLAGSVAGVLVQMAPPAWSGQPDPTTLPTGGTVTAGQAAISQSGAQMNVTQGSQKAIINWQTFNIGSQAQVDFRQPNSTAQALNRVLSADPSAILGKLTANGQIILINPSGVVFGNGAKVDVGGLVASVLDIKDADFLAGTLNFQRGSADGAITNKGRLSAADGGYIALLAPEVRNDGVIEAHFGTVALAAGDAVTLDMSGNGRLTLKVDPATVKALVDNRGMIVATDGQALLSSQAVNALLGGTIKNGGTIEANSLTAKGGDIVLDASGGITLAGTLDITGATGGGAVTVTGSNITLASDGKIDASGAANGNGGSVSLVSAATTTIDGQIDARGGPQGGDGGWVLTSGNQLSVGTAFVDTRAPAGTTGTWMLNAAALTVADSGGSTTGTALGAALANNNVTLLSSGGDVTAAAGVTWSSGNFLQLSSFRDVNVNAPITNSDKGNVILRADNTGIGTGTVSFTSGGHLSTGGLVSIFYNPASFTTPTNFSGFVSGGASLTAYMLVNTLDQLQAINTNLAGDYALGRDIDASPTAGWNGGAGFVPLGSSTKPFIGIFEGDNHTITELTIKRPTENDVGLFGEALSATIRNVGLVGGSVTGNEDVGDLIGQMAPLSPTTIGSVTNSFATGTVSGISFVGGLIGSSFGTVDHSHATGAVSGSVEVGGLLGFDAVPVTNSYATGTVTGIGIANDIGGLEGANLAAPPAPFNSFVIDSYATGAVVAGAGSSAVGGLVGNNLGPIMGSFATGTVTVGDHATRVGGLVGDNSTTQGLLVGNITDSFATGAVTVGSDATAVGGLVGFSGLGTNESGNFITGSYASGAVRAGDRAVSVGGLVGNNVGFVVQSFAKGSVTVGAGSAAVGGLVGHNGGEISNSYATGSVVAGSNAIAIGGLVGDNLDTITNTYSTGLVFADVGATSVGGLVGRNTGTVTSSYWNLDTSGQTTSAAGTGLTNAQMMQQPNFVGWDFTTIWTLPPGSFPKLIGVGGQ